MRLRDLPEELNAISGDVIDAAIEVHRLLGPLLLESVHRRCLMQELRLRGHHVDDAARLDLDYKGLFVGGAYKIDLLVDDTVVVELKCVEAFRPEHEAQLLTYLAIAGKRLGILLDFHAPLMKDGWLRRAR